jgi:hypothetical protein
MKKAFCAIFIIYVGISSFAQSGVIKEITGQVELKAPGSASFVAAKVGDSLTEDTIISTDFKSVALIEVGSAILTVRPLTRLTLTEIRASAETEVLSVNLQAGRVRVDLNPPAGLKASASVSSNVASSSARGTSFEFDTRILQVTEGRVIFKGNIGQGAPVSAGSSVSLNQSGSAVNPATYGTKVLIPQSPEGAELNISPVIIPTGKVTQPPVPGPIDIEENKEASEESDIQMQRKWFEFSVGGGAKSNYWFFANHNEHWDGNTDHVSNGTNPMIDIGYYSGLSAEFFSYVLYNASFYYKYRPLPDDKWNGLGIDFALYGKFPFQVKPSFSLYPLVGFAIDFPLFKWDNGLVQQGLDLGYQLLYYLRIGGGLNYNFTKHFRLNAKLLYNIMVFDGFEPYSIFNSENGPGLSLGLDYVF